MPPTLSRPRITAVQPLCAVEGGRITVEGTDFPVDADVVPELRIDNVVARLVHASPRALSALVPGEIDGGRATVRVDGVPGETAFIEVGVRLATGLHQVDNPVFDRAGNLYVTYSGTRGQQAPVSIFRVRRDGVREPFVSGITNPTSMAIGPDAQLYVSSRFDGTVSRVDENGGVEPVAADLGVTCGLAFAPDGTLYVGDRSGTIFRVRPGGTTDAFAVLPASVAAFHLAMGPDQAVYVTAPTLASYDSVYRVDQDGTVRVISSDFGRPQGLAFDSLGSLYVVEALAGASGLYRVRPDGSRDHVVAGPGLIGVAFDPTGGLVVCSNETVYRLDVNFTA